MSAFSWNKVIKEEDGAAAPTPQVVQGGADPSAPPVAGGSPLNTPANYQPQSVHDIELTDKYKDHFEPGEVQVQTDALPVSEAHIDEILRMALDRKASDIHLTAAL